MSLYPRPSSGTRLTSRWDAFLDLWEKRVGSLSAVEAEDMASTALPVQIFEMGGCTHRFGRCCLNLSPCPCGGIRHWQSTGDGFIALCEECHFPHSVTVVP